MNHPSTTQSPSINRLAMLSLAGASIEWYDFFLYGVGAALVFPALFFPKTMPHSVALVASFSTFAVGFVARPIGAIAFGHIGDRVGRKSALAIAMVMMGLATTLIACLPSYAAIGVAAPITLVVLRFLQGLAIGGQWGGAMLLLVESAPAGRRGFYGSVAQVGVPVGVVLANLAFLLVGALTTPEEFQAWGWRLPFLLSVALVGLGVYLHRRVAETPVYRQLLEKGGAKQEQRPSSPVLQALRQHPREIILAAVAHIAVNLCFYICITYTIAYSTDVNGLHMSRTKILSAVVLTSVLMAPALLLAGALSDRYGRRRVYMTGALLTIVGAFIMFPLLATKSLPWMILGISAVQGSSALMYGPQAALFGELFKTQVRYSGASFAYQSGAILGGGFAPLIATELTSRLNSTIGVSFYMAAACAMAFVAVWKMRETSATSLTDAD
jgi:metabolite-proton symporter